jgi:prefoldin subunit 5
MQEATPAPVPVIVRPGVDAPQAVYRAFNAARRELGNQLETLEDKRRELASQLQGEGAATGASKTGIEARIAELDKRISEVDKQIAQADADVARSAAVPGAVVPDPPRQRDGPPEEAFVLGGIFIFVVLLPMSIAMARRIWKRSSQAVVAFPQELADRLNRLDQSMDSVAIEVERIGEGQRFVTRVMTENGARAIGAGAAQPLEVAGRESTRVARPGEFGER